ncbi:unnamed protein product, partial [Ixodes hexagonus]
VLLCCLFAYATCGVVVENVPAPQPYSFGYDNTDEFGTRVTRQETGDANNNKVGSYSYVDPNGITRAASYVADAFGFRVNIETNEPGTKTSAPADASIVSSADVAPAPVVVKAADPVVVKAVHPTPVAVHAVPTTPVVHPAPVTYTHHATPVTYA